MRLVVALLTSLSLLHLTSFGERVACAPQEANDAHAGMVMTGATHQGNDAAPSQLGHVHSGDEDSNKPVQGPSSPGQERCCASMSSCGVNATASAIDRPDTPIRLSAATVPLAAMVGSARNAPEPPPPKA